MIWLEHGLAILGAIWLVGVLAEYLTVILDERHGRARRWK